MVDLDFSSVRQCKCSREKQKIHRIFSNVINLNLIIMEVFRVYTFQKISLNTTFEVLSIKTQISSISKIFKLFLEVTDENCACKLGFISLSIHVRLLYELVAVITRVVDWFRLKSDPN